MRVVGDDNYSIIAIAIAETAYTVQGLVLGTTYQFVVEARNDVGYSEVSDSITILHALIPDIPSTPLSTNSGQDVVISWSEPEDNGSAITSYTIVIR